MNLISVIIPVYNVKKFLKKCVNSVSSQSYTNLEIILVNDGSTDGSELICNECGEEDSRVKIIHKKNGGLSEARNVGTENATGNFIFYLDSDDYIKPECIELLYQASKKYEADIVQSNFYYEYSDHLLYDNILRNTDKVFNREEAIKELLEQKIIKNFAWGKLIKADIAKNTLFPRGKYFEDTFWKFYIIHECTKYVALAKPMVYYFQRSSSISGKFSIRNLDQLEGEVIRLEFLKKNYKDFVIKGLEMLNKKMNQHEGLLKSLNVDDQLVYKKVIKKYREYYQLSEGHLKPGRLILNKVGQVFMRVKNRFTNSGNWIKIKKEEIDYEKL